VSAGVRRVREHLVERDRRYATSWAAAYAEMRIGEALEHVTAAAADKALPVLQDAAAVLAVLGETPETAEAALRAEDRAAQRVARAVGAEAEVA
jgi:hypothetical protein